MMFLYIRHSPFSHLTAYGDNICIYAKMMGIYLLFATSQRITFVSKSFLVMHLLQGRLIHLAAFGCYGSAKCASTLCSHLNRNLPCISL